MSPTPDQQAIVDRFAGALETGQAALFAGAGLSASAGCVDWRGFSEEFARDMGLDVDRETMDLLATLSEASLAREAVSLKQRTDAILSERARIGSLIHDGVAQELGALTLQALKTGILLAGFPPQFNLIAMAAVVSILLVLQAPPVHAAWQRRWARTARA